MSILDNNSALRKIKIQAGLTRSTPACSSSYILTSKIRKILKSEVLPDNLDDIQRKTGKPLSPYHMYQSKLSQRLEKMDQPMLQVIYNSYLTDGLIAMVGTLQKPIAYLKRQSKQLNGKTRKQEKTTINDVEDVWFNPEGDELEDDNI